MGYVETVLEESELYALPMMSLAAGVAMAVLAAATKDSGAAALLGLLAFSLCCFGLIGWVYAWIERVTTEIAITDRRIIMKRGLIRRSTVEMNADQIESVSVDQSITGRLFDFGTVTINGTGAGIEPISGVAAPLILRKAVLSVQPRRNSREAAFCRP
jgi:uncharacterized membrane protein YdbT with pleckstrin-like domain